MVHSLERPTRVSVVGIDGSGKSTATHEAALQLSETYKGKTICVVDSAGASDYRDGVVVDMQFRAMERMKSPNEHQPRIVSLGRTALFTVARRAAETAALHRSTTSLTIGVRDPYRIDPAAYAPLFLRDSSKLSPAERLALFSHTTTAPHPALVALLAVDPQVAYQAAVQRGTLDGHETPEGLADAYEDLMQIVEAYHEKYAVQAGYIEALRPDTSDTLAMQLEPYMSHPDKQ